MIGNGGPRDPFMQRSIAAHQIGLAIAALTKYKAKLTIAVPKEFSLDIIARGEIEFAQKLLEAGLAVYRAAAAADFMIERPT